MQLLPSHTGTHSHGPASHDAASLTGAQFNKMCKDSGLFAGGKVTPTDADLIFTQSHARSARVVHFAEFCTALEKIAGKGKESLAVVAEKVILAAQKIDSSRAEPVHAASVVQKLTV